MWAIGITGTIALLIVLARQNTTPTDPEPPRLIDLQPLPRRELDFVSMKIDVDSADAAKAVASLGRDIDRLQQQARRLKDTLASIPSKRRRKPRRKTKRTTT
jgi:hypothetical protein